MLYSIGKLASLLGVSIVSLRRWHKAGNLIPATRTPGGHRRYDIAKVKQELGLAVNEGRTIAYARVSSHAQKEHLNTQAER